MGLMYVRGGCGWLGGAHHKNQLNMLPFSVKTDILHIIALSLRGCTSSLSKHASQDVH